MVCLGIDVFGVFLGCSTATGFSKFCLFFWGGGFLSVFSLGFSEFFFVPLGFLRFVLYGVFHCIWSTRRRSAQQKTHDTSKTKKQNNI